MSHQDDEDAPRDGGASSNIDEQRLDNNSEQPSSTSSTSTIRSRQPSAQDTQAPESLIDTPRQSQRTDPNAPNTAQLPSAGPQTQQRHGLAQLSIPRASPSKLVMVESPIRSSSSKRTPSTARQTPNVRDLDLTSLKADELAELQDQHADMRDFGTGKPVRVPQSGGSRTASASSNVSAGQPSTSKSVQLGQPRSGPPSAAQSRSVSAQRPSVMRERTRSKTRTASSSREASDDEAETRMSSSMSPALVLRRNIPAANDDDDEVEPIDRGEELVRKRMKDRARQKKEAEKAKRRDRSAIGGSELERRTSYASVVSRTPADELSNPFNSLNRQRGSSQAGFSSRIRASSRSTARDELSEGYASSAASTSEAGTPTPGSPLGPRSITSPRPNVAFHRSIDDEDNEGIPEEAYDQENTDASDDEDIDEDVEYTLKDRQDAINIEHPFGLPIWKPALYKKSRSVTRNAETALHAVPSQTVVRHLAPVNILWTVCIGTWLALTCLIVSVVLSITPWGGRKYGQVVWELAGYLFWPFGKYVEGWIDGEDFDDLTAEPDEESGQPASETVGPATSAENRATNERERLNRSPPANYGTNTSPANSTGGDSLGSSQTVIGVDMQHARPHDFRKGNTRWRLRALGRVCYWLAFYLVIAPIMLLACTLCWGLVFTVPMAKLLWVLLRHLNNEPLALHFRSPPTYVAATLDDHGHEQVMQAEYPLQAGQPAPKVSQRSIAASKARGRLIGPHPIVLLCTYRAAGLQYYKYTVDGVNIMFINLLSLVFFVIFDFFVIEPRVEHHQIGGFLGFIASQGFIFILALLSVIPLSYFIGMAVASISAQSSIGMGAVINASFGSIIEIILYSIALTQAKGELVEGSIVGSILAGVLLMPGASMIGGAMRRKEQRFNARSAGVTSTMLIMAIIGILTPTMFYEIYGSFELLCTGCEPSDGTTKNCRTCYYEHVNPALDPFYNSTVKLLSYWCAAILVLSYLIGLWFSLRTHASHIWQNVQPHQEAGLVGGRLPSGTTAKERMSIYQRMLPQHLLQAGKKASTAPAGSPHETPVIEARNSTAKRDQTIPAIALPHGMTAEEVSRAFEVVAATASAQLPPQEVQGEAGHNREASKETEQGHGGHDAPNWSRFKSASVLLACTVLYAIIAEILVDVVDVVLQGSGIPEKFLGVTLFALVPNTTEFMNAISFAINGNIALSMEIGSAYALQVCLIQAPAMLAFSSFYNAGRKHLIGRTFSLIVPRWDVIAIVFSVFLLTYVYIEARANYYRGTILCLSYFCLLGGFALNPANRGTSDNPDFQLTLVEHAQAIITTLFTK